MHREEFSVVDDRDGDETMTAVLEGTPSEHFNLCFCIYTRDDHRGVYGEGSLEPVFVHQYIWTATTTRQLKYIVYFNSK